MFQNHMNLHGSQTALLVKKPEDLFQNHMNLQGSQTAPKMAITAEEFQNHGPMSRLWTQKVELFSPYLIARRDVSYAARASSSTCCGVL